MKTDLLALVETRMREALGVSEAGENVVTRAAHDHLTAGGSRIRARLSLHASIKLGLSEQDAIALATVCELLHNASLIQDDLLDRATLRRGRPSVWATYSDAAAVCAGDLLLASAYAAVQDLSLPQCIRPVLALVHRRTRQVILGQGMEQTSSPDTLEGYEAVAVAKSASLLLLPLELSLLMSGEEQALPGAWRAASGFAKAYQMMDDLEDYQEDMRSGALNVVAVVQRTEACSYEAACARVLARIEDLLQTLVSDVETLPLGCGSLLTEYAETMRARLALQHDRPMEVTGFAHHAR